jgi:hypothetical protein
MESYIDSSHRTVTAERVRSRDKQAPAAERRFQLVLIKPSHYDDDGYVIRWWRAMIASNSLAALYGIAADCTARQVLGLDVAIDIDAIDELNTRVDIPRLIARLRRHGCFGLIALVGVQSNQYPRARSTSPVRSATPASRSPWAASTSRAACRCWTVAPSNSMPAAAWASRCSPAKPRAGWTWSCGTRRPDNSRRSTIF